MSITFDKERRAIGVLHRSSSGRLSLLVRCPFCGKVHEHGAEGREPSADLWITRRGSHCKTGTRGYQIAVFPGEVRSLRNVPKLSADHAAALSQILAL